MEVLKYTDKTLSELREEGYPPQFSAGNDFIVICRQEEKEPPYINTGSWEVLHSMRGLGGYICCHYIGMFWELSDAEMFVDNYLEKHKKLWGDGDSYENIPEEDRMDDPLVKAMLSVEQGIAEVFKGSYSFDTQVEAVERLIDNYKFARRNKAKDIADKIVPKFPVIFVT